MESHEKFIGEKCGTLGSLISLNERRTTRTELKYTMFGIDREF